MDSFIYALVLVPAMRELLPKSGIPATTANIGYYGGLLFALFLIGWGMALLWGPVADRFGRVRTLMFTIICFSIFTFLSAFSTNIWMLAVLRLCAGIGIGGEWAMGATLISEEWPETRRTMGAALMHTGYYFGFFLAALANYFVGSRYGWRWMFIVGGVPALLVIFIRKGMHEPARWEAKRDQPGKKWTLSRTFLEIFSPRYRLRTFLNLMYQLVSTIGLWAGTVYVPAAITYLATRSGHSTFQAARLASDGTAILSVGTILGALSVPFIADRLGRKGNQVAFYSLMLVVIVVTFGYVFYLQTDALRWFFVCLFFLGIGGANYTVYSFWLPEQYETECRASALAFAQNVGRFAGAGATFLVGAGIRHFQTLGFPVALTAIAFVVGLMLLPFGVETKGKPLPS
ncbi:MAG TPA: MFS transporter [Candidatus Dormibacteraeota bacterium]|nr:MFS transporter [Candidatus Dormibacteraeota bacterium]